MIFKMELLCNDVIVSEKSFKYYSEKGTIINTLCYEHKDRHGDQWNKHWSANQGPWADSHMCPFCK